MLLTMFSQWLHSTPSAVILSCVSEPCCLGTKWLTRCCYIICWSITLKSLPSSRYMSRTFGVCVVFIFTFVMYYGSLEVEWLPLLMFLFPQCWFYWHIFCFDCFDWSLSLCSQHIKMKLYEYLWEMLYNRFCSITFYWCTSTKHKIILRLQFSSIQQLLRKLIWAMRLILQSELTTNSGK